MEYYFGYPHEGSNAKVVKSDGFSLKRNILIVDYHAFKTDIAN